jgi:hypothetical protein
MKTYGLVEVCLHSFLTSSLGGGKWSASRPDPFERSPLPHPIPIDRRLKMEAARSSETFVFAYKYTRRYHRVINIDVCAGMKTSGLNLTQ